MNTLFAFFKKEWMEQVRTGRALILGIVFVLLGMMNPAIAKLTPWMLELMAESMAEIGMSTTAVAVDAMTSWQQFFKNMPIGLIVFVLMQSGCFTAEYQSGTLIPVLTRGLARHKVVTAKAVMLSLFWTVCYWMCFGITYVYNAYFWDNAVAKNLLFASAAWWLFGLFAVSASVFFSTLISTSAGVLIGTAAVCFLPYALGMIPEVGKYLPTVLTDGMELLTGSAEVGDRLGALSVTVILTVAFLGASYPLMKRKKI